MDSLLLARFTMGTLILVAAVASMELPCLPDQQSYRGVDDKHFGPSHFAVDFKAGKFAIERRDGSRMVKDFTSENAKRYDINGDKCTFQPIPSTRDIPQCVPENAKMVSGSWMFKNIDNATLYYAIKNPSFILKKLSPDGATWVTFFDWMPAIQDPSIFDIPSDCNPANARSQTVRRN